MTQQERSLVRSNWSRQPGNSCWKTSFHELKKNSTWKLEHHNRLHLSRTPHELKPFSFPFSKRAIFASPSWKKEKFCPLFPSRLQLYWLDEVTPIHNCRQAKQGGSIHSDQRVVMCSRWIKSCCRDRTNYIRPLAPSYIDWIMWPFTWMPTLADSQATKTLLGSSIKNPMPTRNLDEHKASDDPTSLVSSTLTIFPTIS